MTHLRVELNTITENVTSDVIHKLYETAKAIIDAEEANDVQESLVSLKGNLLVSKAYGDEIDWLEAKFPDLHITTGARYIRFADDAVYARLSLYLGDGTGITISEITNANIFSSSNDSNTGYPYFRGNTSITSFDELGLLPLVTTIPSEAFRDTSNLTTIDLSNVTSVGNSAFLNCTALTTADLSNCSSIDGRAFSGCTSLTSVDLSRCTTFGSKPFEGCTNLTTITLSNSLTTLPAYALSGCTGLTTINGGSNIASYGEGALENCSSLTTTIDLSNTTSIASKAFKGCSNITFTNMDKVSEIGTYCFQGCNTITNAEFKDGVIIHFDSFWGLTGLQSIRFKGAGTIEPSAFRGCSSLTSITFDGDVMLGNVCFSGCNSLLSVDLSNISEASLFYSFSGIGAQFANCPSLTSAILNPNITKLPPNIFVGCGGSSGFSITIPAGVTDIGAECFYATNAHLTVLATTPPTVHDNNTLSHVADIKVPYGCKNTYDAAPYWSAKASVISELPQS